MLKCSAYEVRFPVPATRDDSGDCLFVSDKTVLVTGASSGIGKETAIQFALKGANVILVARRDDLLKSIAADIISKCNDQKIRVTTRACDVSKKDQVANMIKSVLDEFDNVDILVNNAGFAISGAVSDISIEDIESQMSTNYLGMIYCTKNLLQHMTQRGSGHIVNVASVAASFGLPGIAPYCASKFAMLGFSEGLRHELRGTGVGVTVVSPIMVRTEFFDHPCFKNVPVNPAMSLHPKTVAKAIQRAANSPRLEIIVPPMARIAVWLKCTFPFLINPILGKAFKRYM